MKLKLLVSPLTKGAFFAQHLEVAQAELQAHVGECRVEVDVRGSLEFLTVELPAAALPLLARLSFVQGIFEDTGGEGLRPLDQRAEFVLPEELVWGAKYAGKTNEVVTQLAINLALQRCEPRGARSLRLLDPMAGRGTTLLWAARYGLCALGIERDRRALDDLQRHVKKQTKLHRIKHQQSHGFVGRANRQDSGRFLQYVLGGATLKLIVGDSRDAVDLLQRERFDLIVADLPYGVQHVGPRGTRNPMEEISACAPGWAASLRGGGAMVLIFNAKQPKRAELVLPFAAAGLVEQSFSARHRMSESIVRDLVVFTRT